MSCFKKWMRYSVVFPIFFISKSGWQKLYDRVCFIQGQNPVWWVWIAALILLTGLYYVRSVEVYTYNREEEIRYLGRLPVWWEKEKKVYIPAAFVAKSPTGRFVLKCSRRKKCGKAKKLIVNASGVRWSLEWKNLMELQLPEERNCSF